MLYRLPFFRLVSILVSGFFHLQANAQVIHTGHVVDVATQSDLGQVKVEWLKSGITSYTNLFGDFVLKGADVPKEENIFWFYDNTLLWEGERNFLLKIFGLDGRLWSEHRHSGSGESFLLPRLQQGLFLVTIISDDYAQSFKLLSDGQKTIAVDRQAVYHSGPSSDGYDTLLLTKEGYYSRKVAVPRKSTIARIGMLKGSYENLHYFNELIDPIAFEVISSAPSRSNASQVTSVKLVYDIREDQIYYVNSRRYDLHFTFAEAVLGFSQGHFIFNQTQYPDVPERYLHLANLNYFKSQERYVLQFVTASEMTCEQIRTFYNKIIETSFLKDRLYFNSNKPEWDHCAGIRYVSSEELFEGQNYQALNLTENYGYLKKVDLEDLENTYLGRHDIVLLNGIPNDIPVVAGIITTEFQTPLSHINILSHSRNTPNMVLRDGWENQKIDVLLGELVYLNVQTDSFTLRPATMEEAQAFWAKSEPQQVVRLEKDTDYAELVAMEDADISYLNRIGGKAANFAELMNIPNLVPVPEMAFAIPFYYYQQHMEAGGLADYMYQMLEDENFINDPDFRRQILETLQAQILALPIDPELVAQVEDKINHFQDFNAFRFRSSTNAEDLESFSGAGLYDSFSAKRNDAEKTIEQAIKRVWASLWNWRAFEEREYFKIDHTTCAMGILVHRSFPDEEANGVLLTKNLYNSNPGFIINAQYGEYSIVFPEPGIIHDQIMLFTWSVNPGEQFMIEYLTYSNLPELNGYRVLRDEEIIELGNQAMAIKERFYYDLQHTCDCTFEDFGVDIEFKIDSDVTPRKLYIKQARLYK